MLRLLLGTDWVTNRDRILRQVAEDVKQKKGGRILMVPELISHDTERRLSQAAGDTCSRYAEVLSFSRLVNRVADTAGEGPAPALDAGGRVVTMSAAVRALHSQLKAYAAVETRPSFLTELVNMVDEFKRCCISPEELKRAAAQTAGVLAQKLEELSLILESYDSLCAQGRRDPRDQLNWLLEQLENGDFGKNHVFYIDGFPDFTRQHLEILGQLMVSSPCVTVSLTCDGVGSDAMAFEKAGQTAKQLRDYARQMEVEVVVETVPPRENHLAPMLAGLYQGPIHQIPQGLACARTDSVYQECTAAAERILELVRSGCRYRDICVVCGDMNTYRPVVQLVFRRCNIPTYLSGTENILEKNVVAGVLTALDAALGEFDQRGMQRYLRSVLSPVDPDTCDLVENYSYQWGIRGKRWLEQWQLHPGGLDREWTERDRALLDRLNRARALAVTPLNRLRQKMTAADTLGQQVEALYDFLQEIDLASRLEEMAKQMDEAGDNRSAQELGQLWEIVLGALEQLYDALGSQNWDTETFTRLLKLLLAQYTVGTIPTVLDAVLVGPVSAMRCQNQKHLLVLGAAEGSLPAYGGSNGVLSDYERTALRELGVPLTGGAMEGVQAEFAELYGVFCGAEETVYVSCSTGEPSFLYHRLCRMTEGEAHPAGALGPALTDPQAAAGYIARTADRASAQKLGLADSFDQITARAQYDLGALSGQTVTGLYGKTPVLSASQVDTLAGCPLCYFLKYGLRAKERKPITVDPAEFGTYVHAVLEKTVRDVMEQGGFHQVDLDRTREIAQHHAQDYVAERFSQLDSQRADYLMRRNRTELLLIVDELWRELHQAEFAPVGEEVHFGKDGEMAGVPIRGTQMEACLQGYVDRVDAWQTGGCTYFRVVDYKTGSKTFRFSDVYNGIGLQMLLYLYALQENGQKLLGEAPIPAGVQYFPARVETLSMKGLPQSKQAEKERARKWERKGLVLQDEGVLAAMESGDDLTRLGCKRKKDGTLTGDTLADREQLGALKTYVSGLLGQMVDELASGHVAARPYVQGSEYDACAFCPYETVCHPDTVTDRREGTSMKAAEFWEQIKREADHG